MASCGGGSSASSYSSGILADLLHEIPHKVRGEGTRLSRHLLSSCSRVCTWAVRVHLHHDHRDCLVADPDDPGASLSLSSLLIGRGSLWGGGLSLTCLLRLVGCLVGRGMSLSAVSSSSDCGTQVHLDWDMVVHSSRQSDWGGIVGERPDHM